jgi:hypothetical protein
LSKINRYKIDRGTAEFGFYLAGLIDGDGHFSNQGQLIITFHIKDIKLAYYIRSAVGFGQIYKVKNAAAVNFVISSKIGIKKVIN